LAKFSGFFATYSECATKASGCSPEEITREHLLDASSYMDFSSGRSLDC
jgi:hypothetical protein